MTPFEVSIIGACVLALLALLKVLFRPGKAPEMPTVAAPLTTPPPSVDLGPLTERLRGLEVRQKAIESEWEDYYRKLRTMAGRVYREDQVAQGKHKGGEAPAAEPPPPMSVRDYAAAMARQRRGLG